MVTVYRGGDYKKFSIQLCPNCLAEEVGEPKKSDWRVTLCACGSAAFFDLRHQRWLHIEATDHPVRFVVGE